MDSTSVIYLTRHVGWDSIPFIYFTLPDDLDFKARLELGHALKKEFKADGFGTDHIF